MCTACAQAEEELLGNNGEDVGRQLCGLADKPATNLIVILYLSSGNLSVVNVQVAKSLGAG
jgi:hypothetical protein